MSCMMLNVLPRPGIIKQHKTYRRESLNSTIFVVLILKAKIFTLREWYSCRGLALVANSGVSTLGFTIFLIETVVLTPKVLNF